MPDDDPRYRVRHVGGVPVVTLGDRGPGDPLAGGEELGAVIRRAGGRVVFDLTGDPLVSSAVLGLLLILHRKSRGTAGTVRVCCPPGPTLDALQITKLDTLIPTFPTLAAALAGL